MKNDDADADAPDYGTISEVFDYEQSRAHGTLVDIPPPESMLTSGPMKVIPPQQQQTGQRGLIVGLVCAVVALAVALVALLVVLL